MGMIKKVLVVVGILGVGIAGGWGLGRWVVARQTSFDNLDSGQMYQRVVVERDTAIRKAKDEGNYRCCIEPPCTMCYMEANQWNNYTVGTCACDDLIAQGKEPCPQCKREVCGGEESVGVCEI
jgi:hypothetical protein